MSARGAAHVEIREPEPSKRGGRALVSVVLPCLNEEQGVGACVRQARETLTAAGFDAEIIVVDNGSEDSSHQRALEAGATVIYEAERGYGSALRAGFAAASGEVVVMADADGSYDLSKLPTLVRSIVSGIGDLVIGSRFGKDHQRGAMPFMHKYLGTPLLSFIAGKITGVKLRDSQSGFRAFKRRAIEQLELQSTGMELATEMLLRAGAKGLRIVEIPAGYQHRRGASKLSPLRDAWRHIRLLALWGPHVLFVIPGSLAILLGLLIRALTVAQGGEIHIGPFRWRPIFLGTILLVLGLQAILLGAVLLLLSPFASDKWRNHAARFLDPSRLLTRGFWAAGLVAAGVALEGFLLVATWIEADLGIYRLPLASLAQDCLFLGATFGLFVVAIAGLSGHQAFTARPAPKREDPPTSPSS